MRLIRRSSHESWIGCCTTRNLVFSPAVKCDSLTVSTPNVTRLSKDPVALILQRVDMELEEPEVHHCVEKSEWRACCLGPQIFGGQRVVNLCCCCAQVIPPMPNVRRKEMESLRSVSVASVSGEEEGPTDTATKKKKKTMGSDVVRDMRVEIKEAHLRYLIIWLIE